MLVKELCVGIMVSLGYWSVSGYMVCYGCLCGSDCWVVSELMVCLVLVVV